VRRTSQKLLLHLDAHLYKVIKIVVGEQLNFISYVVIEST